MSNETIRDVACEGAALASGAEDIVVALSPATDRPCNDRVAPYLGRDACCCSFGLQHEGARMTGRRSCEYVLHKRNTPGLDKASIGLLFALEHHTAVRWGMAVVEATRAELKRSYSIVPALTAESPTVVPS